MTTAAPVPPRDPIVGPGGFMASSWSSWTTRLIKYVEGLFTPAGMVQPFAGATVPAGWLLCDGRTVARKDYPALAAALGVTADTFPLPDYRNRTLVGAGGDYALGATGGNKTVTLAKANLPAYQLDVTDPGHTHTTQPHSHGITDPGHAHPAAAGSFVVSTGTAAYEAGTPGGGSTQANTGNATTGVTVGNATVVVDSAGTGITVASGGSGSPVNIEPRYAAVNFIIKT